MVDNDRSVVRHRGTRTRQRPDDQRTGIENEQRLCHSVGGDGYLLLDARLAQPGDDDIIARVELALVAAVVGGDVLAARTVGGGLVDLPGVAGILGQDRTAFRKRHGGDEIELGLGRFRRGRRSGLWRRSHDGFDQGIFQCLGIGRLYVLAPGVFSEARDLSTFFRSQAEADDVSGEVDTRLLKFFTDRARVGVAGLQSVGNEYDGGLVLCVA